MYEYIILSVEGFCSAVLAQSSIILQQVFLTMYFHT